MPRESANAVLLRVQAILEATCERDGQGHNLQESQRRKQYRAGINSALEELVRAQQTSGADPSQSRKKTRAS